MSSVAQNRAAGNAAIQAGTLKPAAQPMGSVVANSPGPTITPYPQTPNPYIRTPLPAISTQQPDQQRNWQSGTVPQDRLIGIPLNANPVISAQTITNIVRVPSTVSGGILLETNGQKNPVQNILNVQGSGTVTASVNAQGTLTLTGTSGSATVVNTLAVKRWSLIQAIQGTALATGNGEQVLLDHLTIGNSNGTQAAGGPTATFGPYTQAQAGTGAGGGYEYYTGKPGFWSSRNPYFLFRGGFNSAGDHGALASFIWLCMTDQTSGATMRTATPTGANQFGFLFNSAASSNWIASVGVAGVYTSQNTGIAADAASHQFEATVNTGAGTVTFAIDGTTVATISVGLISNTALETMISVSDNVTSTLNFNIERMYAQCDF